MIYLHMKFHMPISKSSLVMAIKLQTQKSFVGQPCYLILQKFYSNKFAYFSKINHIIFRTLE
jgi:hypothetical protein